jgi:hypothetical protein
MGTGCPVRPYAVEVLVAPYTRAAVKSRLFLPDHAGKEQGHNEPSRSHKTLDVSTGDIGKPRREKAETAQIF